MKSLSISALIVLTMVGDHYSDHTLRPMTVERPNQDTTRWGRTRWIEYIARNLDGNHCVPTASGRVADIVKGDHVFVVVYDQDWEQAIGRSLMVSCCLERDPGVWLLIPDARTKHYVECLVVVQRLRTNGIPMRLESIAISPVIAEDELDGSLR